jgi:outer membrane murein-binding lipoprotein Lpp
MTEDQKPQHKIVVDIGKLKDLPAHAFDEVKDIMIEGLIAGGKAHMQRADAAEAELATLRAEVARLKDECDFMKVCGVIELMVRNPNIDSFVKEKEAQIKQLEQDLAYCEDFGRCDCKKNCCDKGLEN